MAVCQMEAPGTRHPGAVEVEKGLSLLKIPYQPKMLTFPVY
jgi:hypothetical protein